MSEKIYIDNYRIISKTATYKNDAIYLIDWQSGILYEYSLIDKNFKIVSEKGSGLLKERTAISLLFDDNDSLFICFANQNNYKNIIKYSFKEDSFTQLGSYDDSLSNDLIVKTAFLYNEKIFTFPIKTTYGIEIFDINKSSYTDNISFSNEDITNKSLTNCFLYGDEIWFGIIDTPYLASFSLKSHKITYFKLSEDYEIESVSYDNDGLWISFFNQPFVMKYFLDNSTDEKCFLKLDLQDNKSEHIAFIQENQDNVFCFFENLTKIDVLNSKNHSTKIITPGKVGRIHKNMYKKRALFEKYLRINNEVYIIPWIMESLPCVNLESMEINNINTLMKGNCLNDLKNNQIFLKEEICENTLNSFIELIEK